MRAAEAIGLLLLVAALTSVGIAAAWRWALTTRHQRTQKRGRWRVVVVPGRVHPNDGSRVSYNTVPGMIVKLVRGREEQVFRALRATVDDPVLQEAIMDAENRCETLNRLTR